MAFGGAGFGQTSSSLFGASSSSLFGAPHPTGPTNLFGAPSGFGQSIPASNSLWANQASEDTIPPDGSRAAKWQLSHISDNMSASDQGKYVTISAMQPFRQFSVEEIRLQDYSRGDKGGDQSQNSAFGGFGTQQSQSGFGTFGSQQSQPAFGAFGSQQPQPAFGAAANPFGASSAASAFGATSAPALGGGIFGQSQPAFGGGGFGATSAPAFGASASAPSLFGASTAQSQSGLFGAPAQANTGASLFGAPQQPNTAPNLFGAPAQPNSGAGLFGAPAQPNSGGGLFGAPAQQPNVVGSLFGAPAQSAPGALFGAQASSSALGTTGGLGASFGAPSAPKQSAPSLFGSGSSFGGFGASSQPAPGGGLFGSASKGSSVFGNTGGGLFGSTPALGGFGAPSSSLFGGNSTGSLFGGGGQTGFGSAFGGNTGGFGMTAGFGAQQQLQPQPQGPLEASLTANPFGESKLFSGIASAARSITGGAEASVINTAVATGQSQPKAVSVIVRAPGESYRRTRASEVLAKHNILRRGDPGSGWFAASPMRPWRESGSVFNMGTVLRPNADNRSTFGKPQTVRYDVTPWRTEEQRVKAANIKRLVVEPMTNDPILNRNQLPKDGRPERHGAGQGGILSDALRSSDSRAGGGNGRTEDPFGSFQARTNLSTPDVTGECNTELINEEDHDADQSVPALSRNHDAHSAVVVPHEDEPSSTARQGNEGLGPEHVFGYTEYAKKQLSGSKPRLSLGSNQVRLSWRPGSIDMPTCNNPDYYMIPSLDELTKMSSEELSHIGDFTIGKKGMGEIVWMEPVDVRGLDIEQVVQIKNREVSVYPQDDDVPPAGEGLNKPARIKLFGIHKFDKRTNEPLKDATTAAKMVSKLKAHCQKEGLEFLGYDVVSGTWTFQSNSF